MNQAGLDQIKARAQAALPDDMPPNMDKVKAMALFRQRAAEDVLELVAEVERLQAEVERLTPKPRRQRTPAETQQRIDDNFFYEEYD